MTVMRRLLLGGDVSGNLIHVCISDAFKNKTPTESEILLYSTHIVEYVYIVQVIVKVWAYLMDLCLPICICTGISHSQADVMSCNLCSRWLKCIHVVEKKGIYCNKAFLLMQCLACFEHLTSA